MYFFYTFFIYLLTPIFLLRLWWKGRRMKAYRQDSLERLSFHKKPILNSAIDLWLHAVSLGEARAATPLIQALLEEKKTLLVTTTTPTGAEHIKKHFGTALYHQYLPYDAPLFLKPFFRHFKPRLGLIMETELWPNLLRIGKQSGVDLFLINARISPRAFKRYLALRFFFRPLLQNFQQIFAQGQEDAARFLALGAKGQQLQVLGNLKFQGIAPKKACSLKLSSLKKRWGADRTVLILASTHDPEESLLLEAFKHSALHQNNALLLIAPRHPQRFRAVYQLCKNHGFKTGRRSLPETIHSGLAVILIDSLGELLEFYQLSDFAFIGGTLTPIGGHNVLEPLSLQVPTIIGPNYHHFETICQSLFQAKALNLAQTAEQVMAWSAHLEALPLEKKAQIENANQILLAQQHVLSSYLRQLQPYLSVS